MTQAPSTLVLYSHEHGWPPREIRLSGLFRGPGSRRRSFARADILPDGDNLGGTIVLRQRGRWWWRDPKPGSPVEVEVWRVGDRPEAFDDDTFTPFPGTSLGHVVRGSLEQQQREWKG